MKVAVLSSGSCGNCFYIENKDSAILVDAGINAKQIVKRLSLINRVPSNIKGIFITHEHSDHIRGAEILSKKFNIPVYGTKKTLAGNFSACGKIINKIKNNETIKIKSLLVKAFSKSHSASDPVSFSVEAGKKLSVISDLGYGCKNVRERIADSNFLCIESNHDLNMLESGPYPYYLKNWIKSNSGHLSNYQAGLLLLEHSPRKLKNILLVHLSETNNTPELALNTVKSLIKERYDFSPNVLALAKGQISRLFVV